MTEQVSERDELARVIWNSQPTPYGWDFEREYHPDRAKFIYRTADAALAWFTEHRTPRVVSTVEELDALPVGSVVLDNFGYSWQRSVNGLWTDGESVFSSADFMTDEDSGGVVPVTVLYVPTTESEGR